MRIQALANSAIFAYAALQRASASPSWGSASVGFSRPLAPSTRTTISDLARQLASGEGGMRPAGLSAAAWRQDVQGRAEGLLAAAGLQAPAGSGVRRAW